MVTDLHFTKLCGKHTFKSCILVIWKCGVGSERFPLFASDLFYSVEINMHDFTIFFLKAHLKPIIPLMYYSDLVFSFFFFWQVPFFFFNTASFH